ncbi:MAG: phosphoribosyltransferase family protein [bacterium]|nr:phosphoribosyltransferase family protein [bacterium]
MRKHLKRHLKIEKGLDFKKLLEECGAIKYGHFEIGRIHTDTFIDSSQILSNPSVITLLANEIADRLKSLTLGAHPIDTIASPAVGGVIIGYEVSRILGCRFVFTEKEGGTQKLKRDFDIKSRSYVAIVDDVITTGRSIQGVYDELSKFDLKIFAVAAIVEADDIRFKPHKEVLLSLKLKQYSIDNCPLCNKIEFKKIS